MAAARREGGTLMGREKEEAVSVGKKMSKGKTILLGVALTIVAGFAGSGLALYQAGKIFPAARCELGSQQSLVGEALAKQRGAVETVSLLIQGKGEMKGMVCQGCAQMVASALHQVPGVLSARVDLAANRADVVVEPGNVSVSQLQDAVEKAGFQASLLKN